MEQTHKIQRSSTYQIHHILCNCSIMHNSRKFLSNSSVLTIAQDDFPRWRFSRLRDSRTIRDFREHHLAALGGLFFLVLNCVDERACEARRQDAVLGGRQTAASVPEQRSEGGAGSRCQGRNRKARLGEVQVHLRGACAATTGQGAAQLRRRARPRPQDQRRLHPGLQRSGRSRRRPSSNGRRGADPQR